MIYKAVVEVVPIAGSRTPGGRTTMVFMQRRHLSRGGLCNRVSNHIFVITILMILQSGRDEESVQKEIKYV